ncbi:MAG TPA: hypothetical protein VNJ08_04390 [Bacteriovoracaceae bacterium]|nr:hypothetical protein [Bacteriovoracaceae bacterium]
MKMTIALLSLLTVFSCGDKDSSNGSKKAGNSVIGFPVMSEDTMTPEQKKEVIAQMIKNHGPTTFGTSKITKTTGLDIAPDLTNGKFTLIKKDSLDTEIILKVDGQEVYTYMIELDLIKKTEEISVNLKRDPLKVIEADLLKSNMSLNGDSLSFSIAEAHNQISTVADGVISVANPCNVSIKVGIKGSVAGEQGAIVIPPFTQQMAVSCGKTYTNAEFQELDLTKVMFCDERNGENNVQCEERDMSFLKE